MSDKTYRVNEVFYSLQGEGVRAGTANVFIRFTGCNLACAKEPGDKSPGGFDCDTEFASGRAVTLDQLADWVETQVEISTNTVRTPGKHYQGWLILTGGEPGLQVDMAFIDYWHRRGCKMAIETNGTVLLPHHKCKRPERGADMWAPIRSDIPLDWITCSPKVAEHAIACKVADEVKYVRGYGQAIPKTVVVADHYLISPAFDGAQVHPKTLQWCSNLCLMNPTWRLSVQQHKAMQVR